MADWPYDQPWVAIPAHSRSRDRAPSAATRSEAAMALRPATCATTCCGPVANSVTGAARSSTPVRAASAASAPTKRSFSIICAKGSPGSISPAKVSSTGRTASSTRLSVTTMSRMGCACGATAFQTPSASNMRRGAAAMAEARRSCARAPEPWSRAGSANVTANPEPSARRSAIARASPAKPPPAISTSQ